MMSGDAIGGRLVALSFTGASTYGLHPHCHPHCDSNPHTPSPSSQPEHKYRPTPLIFKGAPGENSVVDKVLLTSNETDSAVIKVLLRHTRRPELGDKFSSRHG